MPIAIHTGGGVHNAARTAMATTPASDPPRSAAYALSGGSFSKYSPSNAPMSANTPAIAQKHAVTSNAERTNRTHVAPADPTPQTFTAGSGKVRPVRPSGFAAPSTRETAARAGIA